MTYTLKEARNDFSYILESVKIAMSNASQRGETTIDSVVVAAGMKAEKAIAACDQATDSRTEKAE